MRSGPQSSEQEIGMFTSLSSPPSRLRLEGRRIRRQIERSAGCAAQDLRDDLEGPASLVLGALRSALSIASQAGTRGPVTTLDWGLAFARRERRMPFRLYARFGGLSQASELGER